MLEKDMTTEKAYSEKVQQFLDFETERLQKQINEYKSNIKILGEDFNMDNPNGGMYSGMELTQTHHEMEKQMIYAEEAAENIHFYRKLRKAPYFAKVTFKPESAPAGKDIYIGLRTLQEHDTFRMLVCDWRAPVASLFYEDFDGTKAFYKAPKGNINGELLNKRQFKFENGKLVYYVDSDVKIDDDILRDVLSSSSGEHLKVIVSSIQREQNKVIRYADNQNLLVLGPAGSGKTSVGFHRLAYLLYQNRTELSSAEIIMFSNNDIFSSYVADIIPELGEMPINYASFYSIFAAELPTMNVADYYSLAESVINGDTDREKSAKIKLNGELMEYIAQNADDVDPIFRDIILFDETIISGDDILERFLGDTENNLKTRVDRLIVYVQSVITRYFTENREVVYKKVDAETEIGDSTEKAMKRLLHLTKAQAEDMIRDATRLDAVDIYFNLLERYAKEINCPQLLETKNSLMKGYIEFEDALGAVFVKTVLGTCAVLSGVKHILIDEAQDLSLMQHKIILSMFPRARVTLLADTNQAILPALNTDNAEIIADLYGAKTLKLNKSYRSTKQINDFATSMLAEDKKYEVFERDGEDVRELCGKTKELEALLFEYAGISQSTCIITKDIGDALRVYKDLKKKFPTLRLCDNKSCELSDSPIVMPLALTKGLEFDNVIVFDKDGGFSGKENEKYMYMASTRALHRLSIFNTL